MTAKPEAEFSIRAIVPADAAVWERLRGELWPDGKADHGSEIQLFFVGQLVEPQVVFFAEAEGGTIVGFAELSLRADIPGYEQGTVMYVEGLYVIPEARGGNVASRLLAASRAWGLENGCRLFVTDRQGRLIFDHRSRS